eukprot:scaffold317148_cov19-Tisochrysis_lutea.AAC.1
MLALCMPHTVSFVPHMVPNVPHTKSNIPHTMHCMPHIVTPMPYMIPRSDKCVWVVMAIAQSRMLSVFGIEMVEVERPSEGKKETVNRVEVARKKFVWNGSEAYSDDTGNKYYVLRSALPAQMRQAYMPTPLDEKMPDQGLIVLVLSLIHMQGGKMIE